MSTKNVKSRKKPAKRGWSFTLVEISNVKEGAGQSESATSSVKNLPRPLRRSLWGW